MARRALGSTLWVLGLLSAGGCDRVLERVGLRDAPEDAPPVALEPSEDTKALAIAVASLATERTVEPAPPPVPVVAPSVPTITPLDELELFDLDVEWTDASSHHYHYGYGGEAPEVLAFSAKARLRKAVGSKAEVVIKATCDDGEVSLTDAESARIDEVPGRPLPAEHTEFRVGAHLFTKSVVASASACRVVVALRDRGATPVLRGATTVCWTKGSRKPGPCTEPATPPAPPAAAWEARDVQFLPTTELGFALVAGTAPAPDRLGVRATCHVGDKHFVEFQYIDGRLSALEPGDVQLYRQQMNSAWEYMRFADCDLQIQAVAYDLDDQKLLGTTELARRCVRPSGIRNGRCAGGTIEPDPPEPSGAPVVATVQNANFNSHGGWYGAYAQAELTVRAPLPKDARFEFVATCGKRVERMPITFVTPLELVYPGQSLRAQGSVSGRGRPKPQACTTEFMLHTKDEVGLEKHWTLDKQCYGRSGSHTPCPGAPVPAPAPTGLGLWGIGG